MTWLLDVVYIKIGMLALTSANNPRKEMMGKPILVGRTPGDVGPGRALYAILQVSIPYRGFQMVSSL